MIPSDLKAALSSTQKIKDNVSQSLEARTSQFTTTLLQSSDLETSPKNPSLTNSDIERSKNLIHLETRQEVKIEELPKDVESHYYKQLLQAKREDLIQEQIFYLEKLSDLYLEKQNWVQAAKLLNCALAIFEKNLNDPSFQSYLYTKLERIEVLFLESKGFKTPNHHTGSVLNHRTWLKNIRILYVQQYQEKVPIQEIITFLTNSYRKLLGTIILDSQEFLGTPPSQWACVGMGSMARDEMCPYSDLEFAFLIDKKTEQILDYFRTLAQLIELRIINLGETKFPIFTQLFGEKSIAASPTPGGFSMDSGGNTPLGKPGFYELIDTPQGLAQYQSVYWMDADFIVTNALSTTCYVTGVKGLVHAYNKAKMEMLNKTDGFFSFTGIPFRNKLALKLLKENLDEFKPNLSTEKQEMNAFAIKKELYRPLQSLISNLTLFCGFELKSTFEMIQQLLKKGILSYNGAANLIKALNRILTLRFEAHTFYQNEEEFLLHIEQGLSQDPNFLYLDEVHLKTLHDIYMVLIPLQRYGEKFLEKQNVGIFAKATFYDDSPSLQGKAFIKNLQYVEAQEACQNAVSLNPNNLDAQLDLGEIEEKAGKSQEALPRCLKALELAKQKYGDNHESVAQSYNHIGIVYKSLGNLDGALENYQKALKIWLQVLGGNHPNVASCYNNIGAIYTRLGNYTQAFEHHQKALKIRLQRLGESHPDVASSYNSIGEIYNYLGNYEKALEFFRKALKSRLQVLNENHPDVAKSYHCIGDIYDSLGNYEKALEFYQKALTIRLHVLDENHPDVAISYNNIGIVYGNLENFDKALEYYQKALKIQLQVFDENHPDVATSYNNIGLVYDSLGEYNKALELYQKALKIWVQAFEKNHPNVAKSYNHIGSIYNSLEDYEKALEHHQKALAIQLTVLGAHHPDLASSYHSIAFVYVSLVKYDKAMGYFQEAFTILCTTYKQSHPNILATLTNLLSIAKQLPLSQHKNLEKTYALCVQTLGEKHNLTKEFSQVIGKSLI